MDTKKVSQTPKRNVEGGQLKRLAKGGHHKGTSKVGTKKVRRRWAPERLAKGGLQKGTSKVGTKKVSQRWAPKRLAKGGHQK